MRWAGRAFLNISRRHSPPEKDPSANSLLTKEAIQKEIRTQEIPILKAFKEFEERKALKNRGVQADKEEEATPETKSKSTFISFHLWEQELFLKK